MGMPKANKEQVAEFIERFRNANPLDDPQIATRKIDTDYFGDSPAMADELLVPILEGKKTATCGALWEWEHEKEPPLEPGYLAAIIDGSGNARCVIETLSVVLTRSGFWELNIAREMLPCQPVYRFFKICSLPTCSKVD